MTGTLTRVLLEWTQPFGELCLYFPSRRNLPPKLRVFADWFREKADPGRRGQK